MEEAVHYLTPTLRALLPDPSTLADMDVAAARIATAVRAGETVGVFGDYDVDGACSTALVTQLLRGLGCVVHTHIPDRTTEGYGPNVPALRGLRAKGASLVICVDCGTTSGETLACLAGEADVIVLDHHKAEGPPPQILATVNPNRLDCASGRCDAGRRDIHVGEGRGVGQQRPQRRREVMHRLFHADAAHGEQPPDDFGHIQPLGDAEAEMLGRFQRRSPPQPGPPGQADLNAQNRIR
jgi:hypothetical protein